MKVEGVFRQTSEEYKEDVKEMKIMMEYTPPEYLTDEKAVGRRNYQTVKCIW